MSRHPKLALKLKEGLGSDGELEVIAQIENLQGVFNLRSAFPRHKDAELQLLYNAVLEKNADPVEMARKIDGIANVQIVQDPKWQIKPRRIIIMA